MFAAGVIAPRMYEANVLSPLPKEMFTALGAGVLWGTMYIPYRKAYLSGMNPLSFASLISLWAARDDDRSRQPRRRRLGCAVAPGRRRTPWADVPERYPSYQTRSSTAKSGFVDGNVNLKS
jgi:hypothetical protein